VDRLSAAWTAGDISTLRAPVVVAPSAVERLSASDAAGFAAAAVERAVVAAGPAAAASVGDVIQSVRRLLLCRPVSCLFVGMRAAEAPVLSTAAVDALLGASLACAAAGATLAALRAVVSPLLHGRMPRGWAGPWPAARSTGALCREVEGGLAPRAALPRPAVVPGGAEASGGMGGREEPAEGAGDEGEEDHEEEDAGEEEEEEEEAEEADGAGGAEEGDGAVVGEETGAAATERDDRARRAAPPPALDSRAAWRVVKACVRPLYEAGALDAAGFGSACKSAHAAVVEGHEEASLRPVDLGRTLLGCLASAYGRLGAKRSRKAAGLPAVRSSRGAVVAAAACIMERLA